MSWRLSWKMPSTLVVLSVLLLWATTHAQESHPHHWSYEGEKRPENWGQLDPAYAACADGREQSPIDIKNTTPAELPPLKFEYNSVPLSITNNGHTIQVNYAPGGSLTVGDKTYALKQFHFHHPSEEWLPCLSRSARRTLCLTLCGGTFLHKRNKLRTYPQSALT